TMRKNKLSEQWSSTIVQTAVDTLFSWDDRNLSKLYTGMVTLQIDRSRFVFFAVQCTSSNARYFLIVDDRLAIGDDSHHTSTERDLIFIPFIRSQSSDLTRSQKTIYTTEIQ